MFALSKNETHPSAQAESLDVGDDIIITLDLHLWYGQFHAIRGVTTTIKRGEVVVIVGPSGSGKSSFLRTINYLEKHQRGDIYVEGVLVNEDTRNIDAVRQNIGVVSQNFDLFPHMRVIDNLTLAPTRVKHIDKKVAQEKAIELLKQVGIADQADKYPHQMSGGEQQRVAIARALAMEPHILLMDEPTSALDVEMVLDVLEVMKDLAATGITMLAVTHEMGFAREAADRIVLFDEGQVVEDRTPDDFLNNPRHTRAQRFLERVL